jgi:hypothetical protein
MTKRELKRRLRKIEKLIDAILDLQSDNCCPGWVNRIPNQYPARWQATEKGKVYLKALCSVPLSEYHWTIPPMEGDVNDDA